NPTFPPVSEDFFLPQTFDTIPENFANNCSTAQYEPLVQQLDNALEYENHLNYPNPSGSSQSNSNPQDAYQSNSGQDSQTLSLGTPFNLDFTNNFCYHNANDPYQSNIAQTSTEFHFPNHPFANINSTEFSSQAPPSAVDLNQSRGQIGEWQESGREQTYYQNSALYSQN